MNTNFAPAERLPQEDVELDFFELSRNACSKYFNYFPLPMLVLNSHRQIVFSNPSCLELFGLSDIREFLGKRPGEAMLCAYADLKPGGCGASMYCRECGIIRAVLQCMKTNAASTTESKVIRTVGAGIHALDLRVHAAPFNAKGSTHYTVTLMDISAEKEREMLERIFFHDILNTAGSARNLVDLLRTGSMETSPETLDLLGMALHGMVEEIQTHRELRLAEKGDYPLCPLPLQSMVVVDAAAGEMRLHELAKGKTLAVASDSEDVTFTADYSLIRRVLINMLKNGLEASSPGDTVVIGCATDGDAVVFEVHNAQVMSDSARGQIFKRSFSTKGPGRGLGTYSIKLLTENYLEGVASFVSDENTGTVFRVRLPRTTAT